MSICAKCNHSCPDDQVCNKCGSDPMTAADSLCVHCDAAERDGKNATPDDLRAKSMTSMQFIEEVLAGTIHHSCYFWLPWDEQEKVAKFVEQLDRLIYEHEVYELPPPPVEQA